MNVQIDEYVALTFSNAGGQLGMKVVNDDAEKMEQSIATNQEVKYKNENIYKKKPMSFRKQMEQTTRRDLCDERTNKLLRPD